VGWDIQSPPCLEGLQYMRRPLSSSFRYAVCRIDFIFYEKYFYSK
jgi:hypothetical protein